MPDKRTSEATGGERVTRALPYLQAGAFALVMLVCVALLALVIRSWVRPSAPVQAAATGARLQRPARPPDPPLPTDPVSLDGAPLLGQASAHVVVVEYSDFQCPFCGRFARDLLPTIEQRYVTTGQVAFAFREFPLPMHANALGAAEAAACVAGAGQFWRMHDLNFAHQDQLDPATLRTRATALGVPAASFDRCLAHEAAARVQADQATGRALAVSGTPTFFVGLRQADGRVKLVKRFTGAPAVDEFSAALDAAVKSAASTR